jgi:ectoine hydroxylase-related dioxygenase (phytanoyl-CoA dioxygenase family)
MRRSPKSTDLPELAKRKNNDVLPIEYPDYQDRLKQHVQYATFREELNFLHENGFVILRNAVETSVCDNLAEYYNSVESLTAQSPPCVEYFDSEGKLFYGVRYDKAGKERSQGKFKLVDLFSENEIARKACFSKKIADFLCLIFDSDILAFQQLGFIYGTEQPLHQDTAYVRVSKPAMIAASWIALEDIQADSGELEFIPRSHRFNHLRFSSESDIQCQKVEDNPKESIWYNYKDNEAHERFLKILRQLESPYGLGRFHAKKGDALIWISYFVHGGSAISEHSKAQNITRKSLVTHYCPFPQVFPAYFHEVLHLAPTQYSERCFYSSKLYPLAQLPSDFSADKYSSLNPDISRVERFKIDPGLHYIDHGKSESRRYS